MVKGKGYFSHSAKGFYTFFTYKLHNYFSKITFINNAVK